MLFMDIAVESAGATAALARRAARAAQPERAAAWARWALALDETPPEGSFARAMAWRLLTRGALVPLGPDVESELAGRFGSRASGAAAAFHRFQCAAVLASPAGLPSRLAGDLRRTRDFSFEEGEWLASAARADLARLLADVTALYPEPPRDDGGPVFVSWTGEGKPGWTCAAAGAASSDALEYAPEALTPEFAREDAALERLARRFLGVPSLRPGQAEAAAALLGGRDLALFWPTGGGKSLAFQLAALLSPGTALVVAPLRALLRDQARRLAELGITRAGLLVGDDAEVTRRGLADLAAGRLLIAFAAPERLDSRGFRSALRGAVETAGVAFVAVDEAHCAARRGHDWRPGYRALGARLRDWCSNAGRAPALAAVSGGACAGALAEASRALGLRAAVRVEGGRARRNLEFHVEAFRGTEHLARLRELLTRRLPRGRFGPGIVFCPRVDGPLGAADVAEELAWSEGIDAAAYTGRAPAGRAAADWDAAKRRAAADFLSGGRGLLCATRAFGLGVDRADVRFTVHLGLPASLEEYFQQAGRAGRDGESAQCWILLQCLSAARARRWAALPLETLRAELAALSAGARDDVSRAYAFHAAAFPGEEAECADADVALGLIGDPASPGLAVAASPGQDPDALTRALVRWEETGVVVLERRARAGWIVRRVGGWSRKTARAAVAEKIARDYGAVESSRRASLAELVELALAEDAGDELAGRLAESVPVMRRYKAS
jgi:RecQ family ATP-dependent DNA helicase